MTVLVTGGGGFVGRGVLNEAERRGIVTRPVFRRTNLSQPACIVVPDLAANTDWRMALTGVQAVIHLAARVHVMAEAAKDPITEFRRVNVEGTLQLAHQAATSGVRRFIFMSSVKVNGEVTHAGARFAADDAAAPLDAYGVSKMEAENGLRALAAQTGMEVVIIRPPLVYGPGVKANFAAIVNWLKCGIPLPLGAIQNKRSLVSLGNLVDLTLLCLEHPSAANQTLMVSDGEDVSTTELLQRLGGVMGRPARLFKVPQVLLELAAVVIHKPSLAQRLCSSLQVDISRTEELLGWSPPISLDEGLRGVLSA
ncbi:NAD-dependent epimerase/dehydratase family protein [Rhodoferax sp.]|uniref:NAD-dependent epimerase/dehydratase family protein n=1 Tax=Rhodoferax sp. TaxID=50421 RepID=UPI0025EE8BCE|nr:NAD-dependent epimerase/dehydratase family protein [Rhodoferax sp.]